MTDWGCMLRAYRRNIVERMSSCHEQATFIPALATYFAKHVTEIEVAHEERFGGKSNYPLGKLIRLQFDLISSFSDFPMKMLMYGGIAMSALGICFGIILALARLVMVRFGLHKGFLRCLPSCSSLWGCNFLLWG